MGERARAHVYVSGRVQGVFFRYATSQEAVRRGVGGWVKNLPDERVEAVFEGPRTAVDEMIAWCNHGPPYAGVDGVDVSWEEPRGESGFAIL
ncbi:MAG: acylphosphatase [Actinomycetota bacterium]|nr:acylphosphatase [Actinomycetota bacterium]